MIPFNLVQLKKNQQLYIYICLYILEDKAYTKLYILYIYNNMILYSDSIYYNTICYTITILCNTILHIHILYYSLNALLTAAHVS